MEIWRKLKYFSSSLAGEEKAGTLGPSKLFPRLEQALASPDLQHSSCVPRDEKCKLFSDRGNIHKLHHAFAGDRCGR